MVVFKRIFLAIILACQCFFFACSIDLPGLFFSHNLDERFKERNTFNYLLPEERTIDLPANYSFLVIADTHIEEGNAFGLEKFKDLIEQNNADSSLPEIAFVVIAGDITQHALEIDVKKFVEIGRSFGVPCYPVIGNHDVYQNNWNNYKKHIGSSTFRINTSETSVGKVTLFMLDSANNYFGKSQLDWLNNELRSIKKAENHKVFTFTHTNLFAETPGDIQNLTDTRERARLFSMLKGRCDIMFSGHLHKLIKNEVGGVKYLALEDFYGAKKYCHVTVSGNAVTYEHKKLK